MFNIESPWFNTWVSLSLLHTGYKDRHCRDSIDQNDWVPGTYVLPWVRNTSAVFGGEDAESSSSPTGKVDNCV